MNKKLFAVICIIIAFVPACIAIGNYIYAQNCPVDIKAVSSIDIVTPDGSSYSLDKSTMSSSTAIDEPVIDFFLKMNDAAKKESKVPDPLETQSYFSVLYKSYDKETTYKYYFTENPDYAYYLNDKGTAYRISSDYAEKFLELEYAASIFPDSVPPKLTLSAGEVNPDSMSWQYYVERTGTFKNSANVSLATEVKEYEVVGDLNLSFSYEPDYVFVTIAKNGEVVFDDLYENLGSELFQTNATLDVAISAKWTQVEGSTYYGEATYRFTANVLSKPVFYVSETKVQPGEFVVISGKNVIDLSQLTFSSEPSIEYEPTFYQDGDYVTALVPIKYTLPTASSYTFTITSGEVSQTVVVNIEPKTFLRQDSTITAPTVSAYRSESAIAEFEQTIVPILKQKSDQKLWDGIFLNGAEKGRSIKTGFGLYVNLASVGLEIRHNGVEYLSQSGDKAYAVNNGTVLYTGELKVTGKVVIIDHGFGLKSLYAHLDTINVKTGDTVTKGDAIGVVGGTGFTDKIALHVGLYVSDVPVCPYDLWESGIKDPKY